MSTQKRVVVIGAGVIGCAIALQLGRKGYHTINIDKNPEVGYGSTSHSCAVVRFSYSLLDTVKLAYEGYHYWKDWESFIGAIDERGLAKYTQCGHLMLRASRDDRKQVIEFYQALGIPYEEWDNTVIRDRLSLFDTRIYGPVVPVDHPSFWDEPATDRELAGGVYAPEAGYIGDPQLATHNLRCAIEAQGGEFMLRERVTGISRKSGRVTGVTLEDGRFVQADIVVNAAGPYSFVINRMAGVEESMSIKTRALRREVHHLPSPEGFDFENCGVMTSDGDLYLYFRHIQCSPR